MPELNQGFNIEKKMKKKEKKKNRTAPYVLTPKSALPTPPNESIPGISKRLL
jgi:hypothetical protein